MIVDYSAKTLAQINYKRQKKKSLVEEVGNAEHLKIIRLDYTMNERMVLSLTVVRSYVFSTFEDSSVFFFEILNCLKDESKQTKYGHS